MLGRWPADKYAATAEDVVSALAARCPADKLALRAFFRQLCFAWLTGNGDVHAKNLSILATRDGEWRASPAYDVPSTVPYGDTSLALSVQGRRRGISRRHLLAFATDVGLPERAATAALDDLLARTGGLEDALLTSGPAFPRQTMHDLVRELRQRRHLAMPRS